MIRALMAREAGSRTLAEEFLVQRASSAGNGTSSSAERACIASPSDAAIARGDYGCPAVRTQLTPHQLYHSRGLAEAYIFQT